MKHTLRILLLSIICSTLFAATLEEEARTKITTLNSLITQAENKGIDVLKEQTTVRTAEIFLIYANWDEANKDINESYFAMVSAYKKDSTEMAELLPNFERQDVIDMLDKAIANINKFINDKQVRTPSPNVDWSKASLVGDQILYEGKPVFLTDYTWKEDNSLLTDYFGQLDGFFIQPNDVIDANGTIKAKTISNLEAKGSGTLGFIFLNHKNPPDWTATAYGDNFKMRENSYTHYDIDNPGAREMQGFLLKGVVPYMAGKKYSEMGYLLCNEPHFYTTKTGNKIDWASGPVSEFTKDKFRTWLSQKHETIEELNSLWNTTFSSFDAVTINIPIDNTLQGTAMWYDWVKFNRVRVTQWYSDLKDTIRVYDPTAKIHLKIMPNLWSENKRGHGIDLESLTQLSDISGNDASISHSPMWGEYEWQEYYAYEWREVCMGYDFMKSVQPDHIILNSENHFLTTGKDRDLYQDPIHSKSTFWLGHIYGLTSNQIWYWPRAADGSIRKEPGNGYAGSNNQQPRITNEVHMTNLDLNAHAEDIIAMQRQEKPLRIFFSETSAITKPAHMDEVFDLYEELSFDGVPIGFVTKNIISTQDNNLWDVVMVYKTEYARQDEVDALQTYLDNGGTVIIDNISLKKNEYGNSLIPLSASNGRLYTASTTAAIRTKALSLITDKMPEVTLTETNTLGRDLCLWKCIKNDEGNNVLAIINVGKVDTKINLSLKGAQKGTYCSDIINGISSSNEPLLKPKEVYFVEIKDEISTDIENNLSYSNQLSIIPNPSNGEFNIALKQKCKKVEVEVYNLTGQKIYNYTYHNTNRVSLNLSHKNADNYLLKIKMENKVETKIISIQ